MKTNNELEVKDNIILKLQEKLDMKDKFLSLITHDLKNPISSIQLISEALSKSSSNLSKEELVNEIIEIGESARNLLTLLDNLLDWSRIQVGSFPFNPENIDLNFIIRANIELFRINAMLKKINLIVETEEQILVYADANMVSTVIRNVLSNAIKFTPINGNITTEVKIKDNLILVSIKDSGVGINELNKKKIFNYNSGFTTHGTSNEKGSGIGLILCKEFVEKNDGRIWLESKEGIGSTFYFTIPMSK
jgi:two-component system sensor histidine kinase/response regulator